MSLFGKEKSSVSSCLVTTMPVVGKDLYQVQYLLSKNEHSFFLHFVSFFHVASLFSTEVDNKKGGVDNEKALELDNRIIFSYFSLISM